MAIFWCKFSFGGCFGASSLSNYWAGPRWLSYKIHFSLHVLIWSRNDSLLLHRIREYNTSKLNFFFFWSAHEAPTYWTLLPFQFASNIIWPQNDQFWVICNFWCSCNRISFHAFPGKNTGIGCHFLLQGIFLIQGSTCCSCIGRWFPYHWAIREVQLYCVQEKFLINFLKVVKSQQNELWL